jgi:hypothetical protein
MPAPVSRSVLFAPLLPLLDADASESTDPGVLVKGLERDEEDGKDGDRKSTRAAMAPEAVFALAGIILGSGSGSV